MAKEFIITEGDIDRELDALVEVRRDKDSQASEVKALVQQLGLVPGDIKQLDRIPGLTKKSSFLAVNKDGIGRVYSVDSNPKAPISGGKGQAIDWASKGKGQKENKCPEGYHWVSAEPIAEAEEEGEVIPVNAEGKCVKDGEGEEEEKPAQIIIPDWNPSTGGATNWMGQTSFSGDTAGKMVNDFLENKPGIGRYAYEFSNLLRVYATMQMIKAPNVASSRAERERQRYLGSTAQSGAPTEPASGTGPNRRQATLQEAVSDSMLKEMEGNFKDYLKGDVRRAIAATDNKEEFGKFVEGEIKKLKAAKTKVDASSDLTKAYNDISAYGQLVGKLMIRFANILDQNWRDLFPALAKKSEEEEESVTEPAETEETEETEEIKEMLNEDKLTEIVIDFNEIRKNELNESFLAMFGAWIKHILGAMLGGFNIPVSVRGSKGEVESFARAVGSEKKYIETAKRYGLDHPNTYKSQARLGTATKGFEKETGIKWPFK